MYEQDLIALMETILKQIAQSARGDQELVALWMNLGKIIGVELYLPHMKAVVAHDVDTDERYLVAFTASISEEIGEHLTSDQVFTPELISKCLLVRKDEVWH